MTQPAPLACQQFWATSFYAFLWPEHPREAPGILEFLYRLRDQQAARVASGVAAGAKSGYGLFEGDFDLFARDHPGLARLKAFIVESVRRAIVHVHGGQDDAARIAVEISDGWYHITNQGGYHDAHVHGGCSWCGIYYLQIGESGQRQEGGAPNGGSRFYSPLWRGGTHQDYGNRYMSQSYVDPPIQDGMLLLFPSYLLHSGLPYSGTKDRVVIAFNTKSFLAPQSSRVNP
jgi:uncharacterized protein (TIGR02466 family)